MSWSYGVLVVWPLVRFDEQADEAGVVLAGGMARSCRRASADAESVMHEPA
jgi:hypothetical protein